MHHPLLLRDWAVRDVRTPSRRAPGPPSAIPAEGAEAGPPQEPPHEPVARLGREGEGRERERSPFAWQSPIPPVF
mgnify:CR=1 FL=1